MSEDVKTGSDMLDVSCVSYCRAEFPTSPAELNVVFDAIDKKRTGKISYQQFVSVLHNDPSVSVFCHRFHTCISTMY